MAGRDSISCCSECCISILSPNLCRLCTPVLGLVVRLLLMVGEDFVIIDGVTAEGVALDAAAAEAARVFAAEETNIVSVRRLCNASVNFKTKKCCAN